MSNHYHLVVTDPDARLPEFMHWFNEFVAKCVNAELGRWESFWAPGSYSVVELIDRDRLVAALVYVISNPVKALLVKSHGDWPGVISSSRDLTGVACRVTRPKGFFRDDGPVGEKALLRISPPTTLEAEGADWIREVRSLIASKEAEIRADARKNNEQFVGRRRVLRQSPRRQPRSVEVRRGLNPRVAASDKWKRIEALQRQRTFLSRYRTAMARYISGDHEVEFPLGTYLMRVRFGVLCHSP